MEVFNGKKGFVAHPVMLFIVGVVIGVILTVLWAKQIIAIPFPFCK